MRARTPSLAAFYVGRPLWHARRHPFLCCYVCRVCTHSRLARLCAQFSTYRDVDGVRPTVDPSGLPSPSTPPLPQSPSPTTATRGAHQAEHHSMSIATQRTKARLKPNRRTTRTTTHGLFSSTTAPSVLSRRLRCSRRPEPHTAVEVAVVSWVTTSSPDNLHPSQSLHRRVLTVHGNTIRVPAGCRLIFRPQTILTRRQCISTARRALLNSTWRCMFLLRRLRVSKPRGGRFRFSPPRA
ncbi:hypothetical protein DFH09DRAFT_1166634, partial [Mycena vulgaris]